MAAELILECRDVFKWFGAVNALQGASLEVETGTVHGLVGHNGAGKSTLVRIIAGLTQSDGGTLRFEGRPLGGGGRREAIRRGVGSVPQELTILPTLTVADNVCVGNEPRKGVWVSWGDMRRQAAETLSRLGIDHLSPSARVGELRPSEKRMVMIAMAVSRSSRFLILDEPTAALGTDEAGPVLELIETLTDRGMTVLYVSHRLDEVERLCDRVTIMRDGITRETLARGEFDAQELVGRMVDELPERPPRTVRTQSNPISISVRGVHGASLRGVDVDICAGEITGFTGLVGSGADELLEIIAGVRRPRAGTLAVGGRPVAFGSSADALRAGTGYLPGARAAAALGDLTVRENVLASSMKRVARAGLLLGGRERRRAEESLSVFGLEDRVERLLAELSGGNQQKVLIARLLAGDAKALVVNDPTAGVDAQARMDIHALLRAVADDGRAVIVRCSEPEELLDIADQIHVLAGGRLTRTFDGTRVDLSSLLEASASSGARGTTNGGGVRDA
jgi:ABC-type sugar transport system ATPase subunit